MISRYSRLRNHMVAIIKTANHKSRLIRSRAKFYLFCLVQFLSCFGTYWTKNDLWAIRFLKLWLLLNPVNTNLSSICIFSHRQFFRQFRMLTGYNLIFIALRYIKKIILLESVSNTITACQPCK